MNNDYELMGRVGGELNSGKSLEDSLSGIFEIVSETVPYDGIAVYIKELNRDYTCLTKGGDLTIMPDLSLAAVGCCVNYKSMISSKFNFDGWTQDVVSGLYVPLLFEEKAVGAIEVLHSEEDIFNFHDQRYLENIAQIIGLKLGAYQAKGISESYSVRMHDLRTPMTVIIGYMGILNSMLGEMTCAEVNILKPMAAACYRASKRLNDMQTNNASLIQIRQGNGLKKKPQELGHWVEELAETYNQLAVEQGKYFQVDNESKGVSVAIDNGLMLRAMTNVLDNALKYTPIGGTITLQSSINDDDRAIIVVSNTGSYIPLSEQHKILQLGVTIPREHSSEGTGKGLAVSAAVIEGHNGELTLYSTLEEGTKFTLALPR